MKQLDIHHSVSVWHCSHNDIYRVTWIFKRESSRGRAIHRVLFYSIAKFIPLFVNSVRCKEVPRNCLGLHSCLTVRSGSEIDIDEGNVVGCVDVKLPIARVAFVPRQFDNTWSYASFPIEAIRAMSAWPPILSQIFIVLLILYSSKVAPTVSKKSSLYPSNWMLSADTLVMSPTEFLKHAFIEVVVELRIVWVVDGWTWRILLFSVH